MINKMLCRKLLSVLLIGISFILLFFSSQYCFSIDRETKEISKEGSKTEIKMNKESKKYYDEGHTLFEQQKYIEAAVKYSKAIEADKNNVYAYKELALCNLFRKRYKEGIELLQKAIEIQPESSDLHYNLGVTYESLGDDERAIECWKASLKYNPSFFAAYNNIGVMYNRKKMYDEAIEMFKNAIKYLPEEKDYYKNLSLSYVLKSQQAFNKMDLEAEMEYLEKAIDICPDYPTALFALGSAYLLRGRYEEAVEPLQKAIDKRSGYLQAYTALGICLRKLNRQTEAIAAHQKAWQINPYDSSLCFNLANAYLENGDREKAITYFEQTLMYNKDDITIKETCEKQLRKLKGEQE